MKSKPSAASSTADRCFLNMIYALLEVSLETPERKPFARKPGLHAVDHGT